MKRVLISLMFVLMFLVSSCGGDKAGGDNCSAGSMKCSGTMLLVCDAGAWVYSKDCSALGTDYVCQQNGPVAECTENNSSVSDGDTNTDNDPVD
jgi:hypothetical protein